MKSITLAHPQQLYNKNGQSTPLLHSRWEGGGRTEEPFGPSGADNKRVGSYVAADFPGLSGYKMRLGGLLICGRQSGQVDVSRTFGNNQCLAREIAARIPAVSALRYNKFGAERRKWRRGPASMCTKHGGELSAEATGCLTILQVVPRRKPLLLVKKPSPMPYATCIRLCIKPLVYSEP